MSPFCGNASLDTLRGPDVAFWSIARQPEQPEDYFLIPPDIAVEVQSPDDRRKDLRAKIKEYLFYSVPLIWLVDPETRTVTVYQGSMRGIELDESDTLDGGNVLPGFSCKLLADLFRALKYWFSDQRPRTSRHLVQTWSWPSPEPRCDLAASVMELLNQTATSNNETS